MSRTRPKVLIVAPHFAPVNAPDGQRARLCLPFLADFGWEAEVLAARPGDCLAPTDPLLEKGLPVSVPVHRHGALPARLCRLFGVGSLILRSQFHYRALARRLLSSGRFNLVFFTTTQYAALNPAPAWRRRHRIPYVVDLQDPWVTDYYERPGAPPPPGGWKYRFARLSAARHEARVLSAAAGVVSVSQPYLDDLARRYPFFGDKPSAVLPFGASRLDLALALREDLRPGCLSEAPGLAHLVFTGAAGRIMERSLRQLFGALVLLRRQSPELASQLRVHLIGTSYAPTPGKQNSFETQLISEFNLGDLVRHAPARIGFHESLRLMAEAAATLVLGSDDLAYTPSKLAQVCLGARRALCIAPAASAAALAFSQARLGRLFDNSSEIDRHELAAHLGALATRSLPAREIPGELPPCWDARESTRHLCALFDQALKEHA